MIMSSIRLCFTLPCMLPEVDIYSICKNMTRCFQIQIQNCWYTPEFFLTGSPWRFKSVVFLVGVSKKTPTRNTHNRKRPNLRTSNEVRLCSETPYLRPTGAFLFFCCFIETRCNFEMVAKHLMSVRSINIHRNMFRALVIIASVLSGKPLSTFTCCEDGFCGAA